MKIRVQCKKHDAAVEGRPFFFEGEGDEDHPDIPVWHVDTSDMWCPALDEIMHDEPEGDINKQNEYYDKHDCVGDWEVAYISEFWDSEVTVE